MNILIVRTSALGDIIQTFPVLEDLHSRFPNASIDWAAEEAFSSVLSVHPFIRNVISIDLNSIKRKWGSWAAWRKFFSSMGRLRKKHYDLIFDLQGNCKSGIVTFFSRGKTKVGFGLGSAREWPNVLATHVRIQVSKKMNIREHYLELIRKYFQDSSFPKTKGVRFKTTPEEINQLAVLLSRPELQSPCKIMVCPGSKWGNKQLSFETFASLLHKIQPRLNASFLLIWGNESEKSFCEGLCSQFPQKSLVVDKLSLSAWQNLMAESNLVIAVDSSALHLCATTSTPSFSLFGPTQSEVFKPSGPLHLAYQGSCPYGRIFEKTCPALRTCPTGACLKNLKAEELFEAFIKWWNPIQKDSVFFKL